MRSAGRITAALLLAAVLLGGCARTRPGIVDTDRILEESVTALRYQKELDDRERQRAFDLDMLAPRVSKEELSRQRAEYLRELEQLKRDYEEKLNKDLRTATEAVARQQRLSFVVVKSLAPYGGKDITQDVIERMK